MSLAKKFQSEWDVYSQVYSLMAEVPIVKELRERHIHALRDSTTILDAGCGPGLITKELANSPGKEVFAVDINESMISLARKYVENRNADVHQGDVCKLIFGDNCFDGYLSNNVLHFVQDEESFFDEMMRVTGPYATISLSSARPNVNVEVMNEHTYSYFRSQDANDRVMSCLDKIAETNRALTKALTYLHEPEEISSILRKKGCSILEEGIAYAGQSFFVVARK